MSIGLRFSLPALTMAALLAFGGPALAQETEPTPTPAPKMEPERPKDDSAMPQAPKKKKGKKGKKGKNNKGRMDPRKLAQNLGLNDEQKGEYTKAAKQMRDKLRALREGGTPDRRRVAALRKEFMEKISGFLTPEQKEKLQGMRQQQGKAGKGKRRGGQGAGNSGPSAEQILDQAKEILVLGPTEEPMVMPLIETIINSQKELLANTGKKRMALLAFLREGGTAEETEAKVAEFRESRDKLEKAIETARKELTAMLDKEQQAKLVALGVLR
jgi:hypothetical protein